MGLANNGHHNVCGAFIYFIKSFRAYNMKTAEDYIPLFEKHKLGRWIDLIGLKNAIQEHDKERDEIIDNMISKRMKQISPQILDDYIDALTELKELLSNSI